MSNTKTPSIVTQIVGELYSKGAMTVSQMCETIKYPYKSVYTKALELQKLNLADKDDNGVWVLREGVTPQTLETGELSEPGAAVSGAEETETGQKPPPIVRSPGIPLDQRGMFIKHCTDIGIAPREAIPTIADIFFSGDINSLPWLNQVLSKHAAGYVTHQQRRLMLSWWANTRLLDFDEEEYGFLPQGKGEKDIKGNKTGVEEVKPEKRLDLGLGWKVDRDKDAAWIAVPGGPMSYQEAVDAAERRALIDSYKRGGDEGGGEAGAEGGEAPVGQRGGKRPETLMEYMMKKMVDNMLDGGKGKDAGDSEAVRVLTERIENMEKERQEERFDRIEGIVAGIAARDPWEEYDKIESMKARLGVGPPVVTDNSPAVQLIKDTTDKMDKNVSRLVGLFERTMLHSDAFNPETTRTGKERETKAAELLDTVQSRDHSRALRKDAFDF
ncbi:hypothetical protein LCGC14_1413610 [marine sediment metagenome]|uniref:Uncharacterized protein n=1 Tax=marine sediment metagenome TaxID=412755 RepID=A0A0F9MV66_9ZZZZ